MAGIGGIGGLGGVDLSALMGLNGIGSLAGTSAAPAVSAPMATAVTALGMNANLQALVRVLQQYNMAEILMAMLLASNSRQCERSHEDHPATNGLAAFALVSALSQSPNAAAQFETTATVTAVGAQSATLVNVAG